MDAVQLHQIPIFSNMLKCKHQLHECSEHAQVSFPQSCDLSIDVKLGKTLLHLEGGVHNKIPPNSLTCLCTSLVLFLLIWIHTSLV